MNYDLLIIFFSYLCGSIPFGLVISYIFKKDDPRSIGSKNIGATNVLRTAGVMLGLFTLILDILKGFIAIKITLMLNSDMIGLSMTFVIIGHIFPIWLKFKGGKGVASYMGFMLATSWPLFIILITTWLVIVKIFKYSAVAAIVSILINLISFKIILFSQFKYNILLWIKGDPIEFHFILFISIIILIKHYTNVINIFKK